MKIAQTKFYLILLSFSIIYAFTADIPEKGYNVLELKPGVTELVYHIPSISLEGEESPFISFTVTEDNIALVFKEAYEIEREEEEVEPEIMVKDRWESLPLIVTQNKEEFPFEQLTFVLNNNNSFPAKFILIDNTKEININLEKFLNWKYKIIQYYPPTPLIFSINDVDKDTTFSIEKKYDNKIYNDDNLMYYCINDGSSCQFEKFTQLTVQKGLNYKFKLNSFIGEDSEDEDYFFNIPFKYDNTSDTFDINEIDYGMTNFDIDENIKEKYFIAPTKDLLNLFIGIEYSDQISFGYQFITQSQKDEIDKEINNIKFIIPEIFILPLDNGNNEDYLIVKIDYKESFNNGKIILFNNFANIKDFTTYQFEKGTHYLVGIEIPEEKENTYYLKSNRNNMAMLEINGQSSIIIGDFTEFLVIESNADFAFIYVDSSKDATEIEYGIEGKEEEEEEYEKEEETEPEEETEEDVNEYEWRIIPFTKDILDNNDFFFLKYFSYIENNGFNFIYFSHFEEKYYLYIKKIFGGIDYYFNNTNVESLIKEKDFQTLIHTYEDDDNILINKKLFTFSANQLLTYFNSYGSLSEMFIQKYDDSNIIQISKEDNYFNTLVKLLIEEKQYTLDFEVDHYIKLDSEFLDAEVLFTTNEGNKYYLNKDNRVIKDLTGKNITVASNKKALIYFYKKIEDPTKVKVIEFDKNKLRHNMKFNIISSNNDNEKKYFISKDFGFKGCYPLTKNMDYVISSEKTTTIYIDNLYDKKLENDLYENEGEKYLIYIFIENKETHSFVFDSEKYRVTEPEYYPNLLTKGNKYNFEVIPGNAEGSIILTDLFKTKATYQIYTCENSEVKLNIKDSNGEIDTQKIFNSIDQIQSIRFKSYADILEHSFESEKEFLFSYTFMDSKEKTCESQLDDIEIKTIKEISYDILEIYFSPKYINCLNQYHIIVAKKDDINNESTFSNPCHVAKLMTQNSDSIIVKTIFEKSENKEISTIININKLNIKKDDQVVITVVSYNVLSNNELSFSIPQYFKFDKDPVAREFNIGEKESFDFNERNIFKFNYEQEGNSPLIISFIFEYFNRFNLIVFFENNKKEIRFDSKLSQELFLFNITLTKPGTYYFIFESDSGNSDTNYFTAYIPNRIIDFIDLEKNFYYESQIISPLVLGPQTIKVQNLKEDKFVLLRYKVLDQDYDGYKNPFEICKDNSNEECTTQVNSFNFIKDYNYTIIIHFAERKDGYGDNEVYYFPTFEIYPFGKKSINEKETGLYSFSDNQLLIINPQKRNLFLSVLNHKEAYITYSNETIKFNNLASLELKKIDSAIEEISELKNCLIIIIPDNNNNEAKVVLANNLFKNKNIELKLPKEENALIYLEDEKEDDKENNKLLAPLKLRKMSELFTKKKNYKEDKPNDDKPNDHEDKPDDDEEKPDQDEDKPDDDDRINYNTLITISSPEKNMEYFSTSSPKEKTNLLVQNKNPMLIYVEKVNKDITITLKEYEGKYALFFILNEDLLKAYLELIKRKNEEDEESYDLEKILPLNMRINSDISSFYDFINLYFSDIKEKIIIYIKKFYGNSYFYECDLDLKEECDYELITKPLPICENKKSIFNRVIKLEDIKLLSGYLGPNSYFDIYLDIKGNSENIINPSFSFLEEISKSNFSYGARYLEKDIEYTLNLAHKHLIKLEPGFDAKVEIYNEQKEVILELNPSKLTGEFEGKNLKIKSNNNAMVYFFGELIKEMKQIEIDPNQIGNNYKIKLPKDSYCIIDFGFKGYTFVDIMSLTYQNDDNGDYDDEVDDDDKKKFKDNNQEKTIYIENIYDKLTERLVEGEKLYLYIFDSVNDPKIDYSHKNINPSNNENTFNVIPKNEINSNLIINSLNNDKIKYQVNYCAKEKSPIKIFSQSTQDSEEKEIEFEANTSFEKDLKGTTSLRFESDEDFVFTYSFIDKRDETVIENKNWISERKEITDLDIKLTKIKDKYTIKFKSNYRNSSTRYIVVIAPKNEKYTKETLSNSCVITKLVTEKSNEVKIINIVDVGENEYIHVDADLFPDSENINECIIGIISQELRFNKQLNFYEPFEAIKPIPIEINIKDKKEFVLGENESYFSLPVEEKSEYNEMFLLHYKLEQSGSFIIDICLPKGKTESFEINDKEGYINFLNDKNGGTYEITLKRIESKLLRKTTESSIKGTFEILSTETPFELDLHNDNIEFKEFEITDANEPSLQFNFKPDKDYTKKISISNYDFSNINEIVSINENNSGDKSLNFIYYTFEKNSNYNVKIKFKSKEGNSYTLEKVNILDYSSMKYNPISSGKFTYNDNNDKFFIIDWENIEKVLITKINKNPVLLISDITKSQSNNLLKEFKNLSFKEVKGLTLTKPSKSSHSVIMISHEIGTELIIEVVEDDDDDNNVAVILIIVFSILIFLVALIFIIRYIRKRKQNIDFKKRTEEIQQETLLKDF